MEFPDDTGMHHHPMPCKNDEQFTLSLLQAAVALSSESFPVKPRDGKGFSLSVNSTIRKRKKKSISREVSSTVHSFSPSPSKRLSFFSMTQALGFFQELMSGLFTEKELHLLGRQGRRASPAAILNVPFVLLRCSGQDPARTLSPRRNSPEGRAQRHFQQPGLFFHS